MSYIREKYTYIQGLADGLGIDDESKEGKLILAMLELLDEITYTLDELDEEVAELDEMVDFIDEDLNMLEDEVYDDFGDEDDFDFMPYDDDMYTRFHDPFFDNEFYCPGCGCYLELEADDAAIVCPECHQVIEFFDDEEFEYEEDEFEADDDEAEEEEEA